MTDAFAQTLLLILWIIFCVVHSLFATTKVKELSVRHCSFLNRRYRLVFNLLAIIFLIPIIILMIRWPGSIFWAWNGIEQWLMDGVVLASFIGYAVSGSTYDLRVFLGINPVNQQGIPRLVIEGWHRYVRHPWYFLALLFIWTRDMSSAMLVSAVAITVYFIIGSRLEENKLIAEFGHRYLEYRRQVSGLIPLPWKTITRDKARCILESSDPFDKNSRK